MTDTSATASEVITGKPVFPKVRDAFYIVCCIKPDLSLDISSEGHDALTLDVAIDKAVENVREYGDTWFVIECRAVRRVLDRQPCVQKIKQGRV